MKTLKTLAAAGAIASAMALAPGAAHAQTGSGFDGYRLLAVTAGVVGGAIVAAVVTDGVIIPVYAWATAPAAGAAAGGAAMAGAEAAGAGAGAGGMLGGGSVETVVMGNLGPDVGHSGYIAFRAGMRIVGAIAGGLYADSWYTGR